MKPLMPDEDIIVSANALKDFSRVGLTTAQSCMQMELVMPKYAKQWKAIVREVSLGVSLADQLKKTRLWPDHLCAALAAGEVSNSLDITLASIIKFVNEKSEINKMIRSQLLPPVFFMLFAVVNFVGFMTFVIPGVAKPLKDRKGLVAISDFFVDVMHNHIATLVVALILFCAAIFILGSSKGVRLTIAKTIDSLPLFGSGMRSIYFGFWAQFMALLDRSGDIAYADMVRISSQIMPSTYQDGLRRFLSEVNGSGLASACDRLKIKPSDPRSNWPQRLLVALQISAQTGKTDESLGSMADSLVQDGKRQVLNFTNYASLFGKLVTGLSILTPMAGMMLIQIDLVSKVR